MTISVVRLGSPRGKAEGPRLGTVRRPPRGVRKAQYASRDFYDAWLPELAPSQKWVSWALSEPWTDGRWAKYARNYRREMRAQSRLIGALAALSRTANFSIGCYCEDERRCHRTLLREILGEHGASIAV